MPVNNKPDSLFGAADLWLAGWVTDLGTISQEDNVSRAIGYVSIGVAQAVMVVSLSLWNNLNTNRASLVLHRDCIQNLMHAPISWFEKNPSGRWFL